MTAGLLTLFITFQPSPPLPHYPRQYEVSSEAEAEAWVADIREAADTFCSLRGSQTALFGSERTLKGVKGLCTIRLATWNVSSLTPSDASACSDGIREWLCGGGVGGNGVARGRSKSRYRQHASVDLGVYYYQDTATGETVWEVPQGAEVIAEMAEGDEEAEGAAAAAAAEAAAAKETARAMKAAGEVTDKKLRVRATIIDEIISTETTFVAGLSTLCEVYIKTLCTDKKLIKGGDVDIVFGGAQHLHGLNAKILIDLKAAAKMQFGDTEDASAVSGRVASVFARFAPYFKIFSTYVNNHANALLMLKTLKEKKKFVTALDLCNKEEGCMMGVESFLIMPVQRIPRYVLLLREILRHTSKSHDE